MNINANLMIKIANSIANVSHGWSVKKVDSITIYAGDGSTNKTNTYTLSSNAIYVSNTSTSPLTFVYRYNTQSDSYTSSQVVMQGTIYECTNNMLFANINILANTYLNTKSTSLLSVFTTGPVAKPTMNTTLLTNINNSFVNNVGQWSVVSRNDSSILNPSEELEQIINISMISNKYKLRGLPISLSYRASLYSNGDLKTASVNINGAEYVSSNSTLYNNMLSVSNNFSNSKLSELLGVIV